MHASHVPPQRYIVGEFVQFAAHRDLPRVGTRVGKQRLTIVGGYHRIWYHEAFIEEGLQGSNTCARNHTMPLGVGWMLRTAFWVGSWQKV